MLDCLISNNALLFVVAVVALGDTVDEGETDRDPRIDEEFATPYPGLELVRLE